MVLVVASITHTVKAGDLPSHTLSTLERHTLPLPQPRLSWASWTVDHPSHAVSALSSHDSPSLHLIFLALATYSECYLWDHAAPATLRSVILMSSVVDRAVTLDFTC